MAELILNLPLTQCNNSVSCAGTPEITIDGAPYSLVDALNKLLISLQTEMDCGRVCDTEITAAITAFTAATVTMEYPAAVGVGGDITFGGAKIGSYLAGDTIAQIAAKVQAILTALGLAGTATGSGSNVTITGGSLNLEELQLTTRGTTLSNSYGSVSGTTDAATNSGYYLHYTINAVPVIGDGGCQLWTGAETSETFAGQFITNGKPLAISVFTDVACLGAVEATDTKTIPSPDVQINAIGHTINLSNSVGLSDCAGSGTIAVEIKYLNPAGSTGTEIYNMTAAQIAATNVTPIVPDYVGMGVNPGSGIAASVKMTNCAGLPSAFREVGLIAFL